MICATRQNDMFRWILTRIREALNRRLFEYWESAVVETEVDTIRDRLNLLQKSEHDVETALGPPTSIEKPSIRHVEDDGTVSFEADHGLVYDNLLPRTRIVLHVVDGLVHSMCYIPKLKRCPRSVQKAAGEYYAPI